MIPTIEQIVEDLAAGKVSKSQAVSWLQQHAAGTVDELRDAYAMAILQGELAAQDARNDGKGTEVLTPDTMDAFAARCFAMADVMLKARTV